MTQPPVQIEIPADPAPPNLEGRLRGAIMSAHVYHTQVSIKCGHRTSHILPDWEYERLRKIDELVRGRIQWENGEPTLTEVTPGQPVT